MKQKKIFQEVQDSEDEIELGDQELDGMQLDSENDIEADDVDGDEGESEEEQDSEDDSKDQKQFQQSNDRQPIYMIDKIHDKLEDISWTQQVPWVESQVIDYQNYITVEKIDDDIQRELALYNQALEGSLKAIQKFDSLNLKWRRPDDYFADMVKSDQHMNKVKSQLQYQQKLIEEAEQRRKQKEMKKYQKQIQADKQKEKSKQKKSNVQEIQRLRKSRDQQGYKGEVDYDKVLNNNSNKKTPNRPMNAGMKSKFGQQKSQKKQFKDTKFGFGGRKRNKKQNDSNSVADTSGFKPSNFRESFQSKRGKSGGTGTKFNNRTQNNQKQRVNKRAGKNKRQQMKQQR